jgi:hypothetical protein
MSFWKALTVACVCACGLIVSPQAHGANIVTNGDFSTGDLSGWTSNLALGFPWHSTGTAAESGCVGAPCISGTASEQNFLTQNLTTLVGDSYALSFDALVIGTPSELKVLFGGVVLADLVNPNLSSFTTFTYSGLVASGSTTTLEFLGRDDPGLIDLTNVSVVDQSTAVNSPVPEPATLTLVVSGLLAVAGVRRKRLN